MSCIYSGHFVDLDLVSQLQGCRDDRTASCSLSKDSLCVGYSQWTSMKKTSQTNLANDRRRMHGGDEGCIAGILRKKCLKDARKESTWKD